MGLVNTNALCRLADVKDALGISVTTYDNAIERLIRAVSGHIEQVCSRKFRKEAISGEKFRGYGHPRFYVARPPIDTSATISIQYDGGTALDSTEYVVEDAEAGLIYREGGLAWTAPLGVGASYRPVAGLEQALWTIGYTGGYVLPNDEGSGDRTLPYQLEDIAMQAVITGYRSRSRDRSIKSESLMSWSAAYNDAEASGWDGFLTAAQRDALAPWRKFVQA